MHISILALKHFKRHNIFKPYHILPELTKGLRGQGQCALGSSAVYTLICGFAQPLNYKNVWLEMCGSAKKKKDKKSFMSETQFT